MESAYIPSIFPLAILSISINIKKVNVAYAIEFHMGSIKQ